MPVFKNLSTKIFALNRRSLNRISTFHYSSAVQVSLRERDFYGPIRRVNGPVSSPEVSPVGAFYSIKPEEYDRVILPFLKSEFDKQLRAFNDLSLMVRKPALDVINALDKTKQLQISAIKNGTEGDSTLASKSAPRFVFYGQPNSGISVQLAHVTHHVSKNNWFVFRFSHTQDWIGVSHDKIPSCELHQRQHRSDEFPGAIMDLPDKSSKWLREFLSMNKESLEKWKPVISRDVEWTTKDIAVKGTPWVDIADYGIKRTKYANDCIGILLREMRSLCNSSTPESEKPFAMLVVDGVNFLWARSTRLTDTEQKQRLYVERLSLVNHVRRALRGDWGRGAIVCSVTRDAAHPSDRDRYTLGFLLQQIGFSLLDPFVPVEVPQLSDAEIDGLFSFFAEHHWLANKDAYSQHGKEQIKFLADRNPGEFFNVVKEW